MNTRTITKLGLAAAIAGLVPLGLAGPAQAATTVTHQGCTVSVDAPIFTNHFNASGAKLFDYIYHLSCVASPGGVSVELRQDRHESDLVGRPGDPDAPDEYTGGFTRNHVFAAAGGSANITVRATAPRRQRRHGRAAGDVPGREASRHQRFRDGQLVTSGDRQRARTDPVSRGRADAHDSLSWASARITTAPRASFARGPESFDETRPRGGRGRLREVRPARPGAATRGGGAPGRQPSRRPGCRRTGWVGIDGLDELPVEHCARLLRQVSAADHQAVILTSRTPLAADLRGLLRGAVFERGPLDLALDPYAVACCLEEDHGVTDPETAVRVATLTAGWPALVHYAGDALARDPRADLDELFGSREGAVAGWLRREVLAPLPPGTERLLTQIAGLGPVTAALCAELAQHAQLDPADAAAAFSLMNRLGLLVPLHRLAEVDHVLVPALEALLCTLRAEDRAVRETDRWAAAARIHEADGRWLWAARARLRGRRARSCHSPRGRAR